MKTRLKVLKIGVVLFFCFTISSVLGQEINRELGDFKEVKAYNGVKVILIPSQENRIEISGHSKDKVKHSIIQDRLEIRLSLDNLWSDDNTVITVHGKSVSTIDANQGSLIEVKGLLKGGNVELRTQEGASIRTELNAESVKMKAVSGGVLHVKGTADVQHSEVNTGGQLFGSTLKTDRAEIKVSTAGKAEIYVEEYCKANASLGGVIRVEGNPSQLDTKTSLGGKIL